MMNRYDCFFVHVVVVLLLWCNCHADAFAAITTQQRTTSSPKQSFLESLDRLDELNDATQERTELVKVLCQANPTKNPGSVSSFAEYATGEWRVVYAPHMATMGKLLRARFAPVIYQMRKDGTMTSHAWVSVFSSTFDDGWWLSVSGKYTSENEQDVCRVDFDEAWMKRVKDRNNNNDDAAPYASVDDVPDSWVKEVIRTVGRSLFIDQFAKFPVSYLDNDLIVFDFELLGTRICALKQQQ